MANILIIEDDELFRQALRLMLEQLGHEVTEAPDGIHGMAQLERQAFDVVMTDLVMPEQEGIETIMQIRRKRLKTKVIAMSGGGNLNVTRTNLNSAMKLGASASLNKPFSADELSTVLTAVMKS